MTHGRPPTAILSLAAGHAAVEGTRAQHRESMRKFETPGGTLDGHLGEARAWGSAADAERCVGRPAGDRFAPELTG